MRTILIIIATAIALGAAYHAFAAPTPNKEHTVIPTSRPKDTDKAIEHCIQATTIQRFMVGNNGQMRKIGGITIWAACK